MHVAIVTLLLAMGKRKTTHVKCFDMEGSLQTLDWNGGLEWWNGMVELQIQ